jgi:DNA-binding NarL/FixJ family response regulator
MRVVIAEDAAVLREGLARLLSDRGHEICATVADAETLLAAVTEHLPDAVIADIRMPPTHTDEGLRAAVVIKRDFPATGVNVAEFVSALERVAAGGTALDPEVISQLLRSASNGPAADAGLASLTAREREVLGLMAEGRSNSGIARKLTLSEGVVEKHIASIFGKLSLEPEGGDNRRVLAVLRYLKM